MPERFKIHEKSKFRLDYVNTETARHQKYSSHIPTYFEYFEEPRISYELPKSYHLSDASTIHSVAQHLGFAAEQLTLDRDEYGDIRINLYNNPLAIIWWELTDA